MERIAPRKFYAFFLACLLVFLLMPQAAFASGERSAKIFSTNGSVSVKRGGDKLLPAFEGMRLEQGDVIIAMQSSGAVIEIDGDKTINVDENTEIALSVLQGKIDESQTGISVFLGNIVNSIQNKLTKGSVYTVDTPTAIMGVRGTIFLVGQPMHTAPEVAVSSGLVETDVRGEKTAMVEPGFAFHTDTDRPEAITKERLISFGPTVVGALTNDALLETFKDASGTPPSLSDLTAQATQYRQQQNETAAQALAQVSPAQNGVAVDYFFSQPDAKIVPLSDMPAKVESADIPATPAPPAVSNTAKEALPPAPAAQPSTKQTPPAAAPPNTPGTPANRPVLPPANQDEGSGSNNDNSTGGGGGGSGTGGSDPVTPPPALPKLATPVITYSLPAPQEIAIEWYNVPNATSYRAIAVDTNGQETPLDVRASGKSHYVLIRVNSLRGYDSVKVTALGDYVTFADSDTETILVSDLSPLELISDCAAAKTASELIVTWKTAPNVSCTVKMRLLGAEGQNVSMDNYLQSSTGTGQQTFTLTLPWEDAHKYHKFAMISAMTQNGFYAQNRTFDWGLSIVYPPVSAPPNPDNTLPSDTDDGLIPPANESEPDNDPSAPQDDGSDNNGDDDDHDNHHKSTDNSVTAENNNDSANNNGNQDGSDTQNE